jgi:hypothetical protein
MEVCFIMVHVVGCSQTTLPSSSPTSLTTTTAAAAANHPAIRRRRTLHTRPDTATGAAANACVLLAALYPQLRDGNGGSSAGRAPTAQLQI